MRRVLILVCALVVLVSAPPSEAAERFQTRQRYRPGEFGREQSGGKTSCIRHTGYRVARGITYSTAGGQSLLMDVYAPDQGSGPFPALVMVHGGGWVEGTRDWLKAQSVWFAQHGYVAATIDYRLAPQFPYPAPEEDTHQAVRFMRENAGRFHVDSKQMALLGTSAGGTIAITAAEQAGKGTSGDKVLAVVAWSPATDFVKVAEENPDNPEVQGRIPEYLGFSASSPITAPAVQAKAEQTSPINMADRNDPPMLVANAKDEFVPLDTNERFVDTLHQLGVPAELFTPEEGHAVAYTCDALEPSLAFLDRYVGGGGGGLDSRTLIMIAAGLALLLAIAALIAAWASRRRRPRVPRAV